MHNKRLEAALALAKKHQVERDAKLLASRAMTNRERARFRSKRDAVLNHAQQRRGGPLLEA